MQHLKIYLLLNMRKFAMCRYRIYSTHVCGQVHVCMYMHMCIYYIYNSPCQVSSPKGIACFFSIFFRGGNHHAKGTLGMPLVTTTLATFAFQTTRTPTNITNIASRSFSIYSLNTIKNKKHNFPQPSLLKPSPSQGFSHTSVAAKVLVHCSTTPSIST